MLCVILQSQSQCVGAPGRCVTAVCDTAVSESVCWCSRPVCYRCVRYCSLRVSVLVLQAGVLPLCAILQSPSQCVGAPGRCVTAVCDTAVSESVCWCSRPVCYRCVRYCSLRVSVLVLQAGVLPLCTAVSESVCWCSSLPSRCVLGRYLTAACDREKGVFGRFTDFRRLFVFFFILFVCLLFVCFVFCFVLFFCQKPRRCSRHKRATSKSYVG